MQESLRWAEVSKFHADEWRWLYWSMWPRPGQLPRLSARYQLWLRQDSSDFGDVWDANVPVAGLSCIGMFPNGSFYGANPYAPTHYVLLLPLRDESTPHMLANGLAIAEARLYDVEKGFVRRTRVEATCTARKDRPVRGHASAHPLTFLDGEQSDFRPREWGLARARKVLDDVPLDFLRSPCGGWFQYKKRPPRLPGDFDVVAPAIELAVPGGFTYDRAETLKTALEKVNVKCTYHEVDVCDDRDPERRMPSLDVFLEELAYLQVDPFRGPGRVMLSMCGITYGSGKTRLCSDITQKAYGMGLRILYVVPRKSLTFQISTRLGPIDKCHYLDMREAQSDEAARAECLSKRVCVTTVHSLHLFKDAKEAFNVVVIDEARTLNEDLTANYTRQTADLMKEGLSLAIRRAKITLVLDADDDPYLAYSHIPSLYQNPQPAAPGTMHLFTYSKVTFVRVSNSWRDHHIRNLPLRPCTRLAESGDMIAAIITDLQNGKRCAGFVYNKGGLYAIADAVKQALPGKKVACITADTSYVHNKHDLVRHCLLFDLILYTTTWAVGIDIDVPAFIKKEQAAFLARHGLANAFPADTPFDSVPVRRRCEGPLRAEYEQICRYSGYDVMYAFFSKEGDHAEQLQSVNRIRYFNQFKFCSDGELYIAQNDPPARQGFASLRHALSHDGVCDMLTWQERAAPNAEGEVDPCPESTRAVLAAILRAAQPENNLGHILEGLHRMRIDVSGCYAVKRALGEPDPTVEAIFTMGALACASPAYQGRLGRFISLSGLPGVSLVQDGFIITSRMHLDAFIAQYSMGKLESTFEFLHALRVLHENIDGDPTACYNLTGIGAFGSGLWHVARRARMIYSILTVYFGDAVEVLLNPEGVEDYELIARAAPTAGGLKTIRTNGAECGLYKSKAGQLTLDADEPEKAWTRNVAALVNRVLGVEVFTNTNGPNAKRTLAKHTDLFRINALYWRWFYCGLHRRCSCAHWDTGEPGVDIWAAVCEEEAADAAAAAAAGAPVADIGTLVRAAVLAEPTDAKRAAESRKVTTLRNKRQRE